MTKDEIEAVLERVRTWPLDRQAYAAHVLATLEQESSEPYWLSDDEVRELDEGEASGRASEDEVQAVFRRFQT